MDTSSILGYKPTDPTQNLSGMLNIVNSMQQNQRGDMALQNEAINLNERKAAIPFLQSGAFLNDDGTLDTAKLTTGLTKIAPTTGMKMAQEYAAAHTQATAANTALNGLTSALRGTIGSAISALPSDASPELVGKTLDAIGAQYKGAAPLVAAIKQGYTAHAKQDPAAGSAFLQQTARGVLPQETQQTMNTPAGVTVSDGQTSQVVSTKPGTVVPMGQALPGTSVINKLAPGQVESIETDAQGNKHVVTRTTAGAIVGTRPLQSATKGQPGAAPGPFQIPADETTDTLKVAQAIRVNSNQAARSVPDQQFNSNQIIKLADETNTGHGASLVAGLKGGFSGIPWTADSASNYNQLGHYMALQTGQLAMSAGLGGTDAGRSVAAEQAGTREWTSDAIKSTARVNRALSTGTDLFNRGVENAVQSSGNPFAAREFQNKWSQNANVDALRLMDAFKNRADDPKGFEATLKELGGVSSDKYKRTLHDVEVMRSLVKGQ